MRYCIASGVFVLVLQLCSNQVVYALENRDDLVDYVISGWQSERERLVSGIAHIRGKRTKVLRDSETPKITEIDLTWSLDADAGCQRYDIHEYKGKQGVWILLPDAKVQWQPVNNGLVNIKSLDESLLHFMIQPDPRLLPMLGDSGMNAGGMHGYFEQVTSQSSLTCKRLDNNQFIIQAASRGHDQGYKLTYSILIDENSGFGMIKSDIMVEIDSTRSFTELEIKTEWEQINTVWLPVKIDCKGIRAKSSMQIDIEWSKVNETIDQKLFDPQHIGAPDDTQRR